MSLSRIESSGGNADFPRLPPGFVPRKRLTLAMDAAADAEVLVLRAPAGGGKTALLLDWACAQSGDERLIWMSLDGTTRTAQDLWDALVRALSSPVLLAGSGPASIAAELNRGTRPVCIVLDDLHLVPTDIEWEVVRFLSLLKRGRIVASTRSATVLDSALVSVQARVVTMTAEQLAFTIEEVDELLRMHVPPEEHDSSFAGEALHSITGGHPLLTRLALSSGSSLVESPRLAADWVVTLLESRHLEAALLIAQSPVVDEELVARLAGPELAGELLGALVRDGLGSRDDHGVFEYHELIGAALRLHAQSALVPEARRHARSVAASYLSGRPGLAMAVFQLLAEAGRTAELWPFAAMNFIELTSDAEAIESVLDDLPADTVLADGTLGAIAAMIQSSRESSPSIGLLDMAAVALDELRARPAVNDQEESFFREAAILSLLRSTRRYDAAAAQAEHLERIASELEPSLRLRLGPARHSILLGAATTHTLAGNLHEAERILISLESDRREHGSIRRQVQRAFIHAMRGEISAASAILEAHVAHPPEAVAWVARFTVTQAAILLESGYAARAREALRRLEPDLAVVEEWPYALVVTARTHIATDPSVGMEDLERLLQVHGSRPVSPGVRDLIDSAVADLALAANDVQGALALVAHRTERDIALRLTAARIGLITGDREAIDDLRRLTRRDGVWPRLRAQAFLLLAVHLHRAGSQENAHEALRRALAITREHRIRLIHALIPRSELETIAAGAGVELPSNINRANPLEGSLAPVSLTRRESALLEQLAAHSPLREIAAADFVALSTIKSQAASLYRKLGVRSRDEAVEAAHRRGILPVRPADPQRDSGAEGG